MFNIFYTILFLGFIISILLSNFIEFKYYKYLKENHKDIWLKLGEPEMFSNLSIKIRNRVKEFENKKEYLLVNDAGLERFIKLKNSVNLFSCVILLCCLVLIVSQALKGDFRTPWTKSL